MTNGLVLPEVNKWKVAIVDDEPAIHQVIKLTLKSEEIFGAQVDFISAYSYQEARPLLQAELPDLILLDMVMECEKAGLVCLDFIRENPLLCEIPVIIISGLPSDCNEKQLVKQYDINGYINKTELRAERLYSEIHSALRYSWQMREVWNLNEELVNAQAQLHDMSAIADAAESMTEIGGWEWDVENQQMLWTDGTYNIFGVSKDYPLNRESIYGFFDDNAKQQLKQLFEQALETGTDYQQTLPFVRNDGAKRWLKTNGKVIKHGDQVANIYGAIQDITEFQLSIDKANESNEFLSNVLAHFNDAVVVIDCDGKIVEANPAVKPIFGYRRDQLIDMPVEVLMPSTYAHKHAQYMSEYIQTGKANIIGRGRELKGKRANGDSFPMELTLSEFHYQEKHLFIGIVRDISERKQAQEELYKAAYYDTNTGLPNLQNLSVSYDKRIERAKLSKQNVTMMLIDVDGFYRVNQAFGHEIGNHVLSLIGHRINTYLPEHAELFRSNGPDFLIFYPHSCELKEQHLREVTDVILTELAREFKINESVHQLSVSIGVNTYPANLWNQKLSAAIAKLELAIKQAKKQGGNCCVAFDDDLNQKFKRRFYIENGLKHAIQNNEFSLVYQPKVNARRESVSAEALLRWYSEEIGHVSPAEFIEVAEQTGLITEIGRWVIHRAFSDAARLRELGIVSSISVNVSANQIIQHNFREYVIDELREFQIQPGEIIMELTETALATDIKAVIDNMGELNKLGISFSIDDFGTGYSSLSYLQRLPINELKIDKSFVDNLNQDVTANKLVDTILSLAKSMELQVVAEGVETEQQFEYLKSLDCALFQGYFFAKPMPFSDLVGFLNQPEEPVRTFSLRDGLSPS